MDFETQSAITADEYSNVAFKGTGERVIKIVACGRYLRIVPKICVIFATFSETDNVRNSHSLRRRRIPSPSSVCKRSFPVPFSKNTGATPTVRIITSDSRNSVRVLSRDKSGISLDNKAYPVVPGSTCGHQITGAARKIFFHFCFTWAVECLGWGNLGGFSVRWPARATKITEHPRHLGQRDKPFDNSDS